MKTTGFSRISKELIISEIEKEIKSRPVFFIAQHGGLSAVSLDNLRAKLRQSDARYLVVKNSLGNKAIEKAKVPGFSAELSGACGITFVSGDIVLSSKTLVDFAKDNEGFKIQTGFMHGKMLNVDQIKSLASLPSKDVLLARIVGGIQAPISRFVGVLAGTVRQVVNVLDAIAKKKGSG